MAETRTDPQSDEEHDLADAFAADHMTVVSCEHGTIWIRLHDADGKVRAYGCYDAEGAMTFTDAVVDEIGKVVDGRGTTCCGSVH
jgi:hypothetical protein